MFASTNVLPVNPGRSVRDRLRSYFAAVQRHSVEKQGITQLHELDARLLRDINVSRDEALRTRPRPLQHFFL